MRYSDHRDTLAIWQRREIAALLILLLATMRLAAQNAPLLSWEQSNGRRHLQLLQQSYPQTIQEVQYRDNDWAIKVNDRWFYWSNARLLPQEARADWEQYLSIRFYNYYRGPPRLPRLSSEQIANLRRYLLRRPASALRRHNGFLDALYGISDQSGAQRRMINLTFLGKRVRVHPYLQAPLARVEQGIARQAQIDPVVAQFVSNIHEVSGFFWRTISGTAARSYHSYGSAVDLLFDSYAGKHVYWRWSQERGVEDWWSIPLAERWSPPLAIIDIFEREGFVWGGKWLLFDTLHFEYRPEILALVGPR